MIIKAVIFDIDDTLTQTIKVKWKALKETGKKYYSLQIPDETLRKFWGLPFNELILNLFQSIDTSDNIINNYCKTVSEFPAIAHKGAKVVLEKLSRRYIICALTSSSRKLIDHDFENSGIDPKIFSIIQTQEDTKVHKPNPEVLNPTLKLLSTKKIRLNETILAGDSLKDYQCAIKAGLKFVAVTTGLDDKTAFIEAGLSEKMIMDEISKLPELIGDL